MARATRTAAAVLTNPTSRRILACLFRCALSAAEGHAARKVAVEIRGTKPEQR